ncbi:ATPase [Novosphingobium decolorationis]|uniref:ATPase n=1 Tax=Novosphingobium decolorationis TaxID=2698673 RepID=A0ABX8E933_9SPHN|nr:ATPase [Novosphingobium decolorationis]QVM85697.1 ATPase [Novosphingobium decolorationis]
MPKQIALPLSASSDSPPRIVVGEANAAAIDALTDPGRWPFHTAILYGPPRSGKSLLGNWFADGGGGVVIDNAETVDEDVLFHAWNRAQETGQALLLITNRKRAPQKKGKAKAAAKPRAPARSRAKKNDGLWHVGLPDLASRLGAALQLEIEEPDDEMLAELIDVHAQMRHLVLDPSASAYLVPRAVRSHLGAERLVAAIDRLSLERKQPPTLAIWREALAEFGKSAQT